MMNRNIVLFGFMGCGKSTVGAELAANTGRELVDTDALIEQSEGMSISEIFRLRGEAYFRDLEHDVCLGLSERQRLIISAGGGALTFRRNIDALRKGCELVLIDVPPEVIYARLKNDATRPLLQCEDKMAAIRDLYARREAIYREAADHTVNGNQPRGFVALDIMKAVGIL
jgi:Shikimate kinase